MASNEHLSDEEAMDYAASRLSGAESARMTAHLRDCNPCAQAAAFWQRTVEAAQQLRTVDPPEGVVRRAVAVFDPALLPASAWKRVLTAFVFDSRRESTLAGVRDGGASFQLLAQAGEIEIDLLCEPVGEGWRITGQVITDPPVVRGLARVVAPLTVHAALSEAGEFQIGDLPGGEVVVEIDTETSTLSLEPFRLGGHAD